MVIIIIFLDSVDSFVEAKWVRNQLADPRHRGLGMRYLTHLKAVWKRARRSWDVWTEFPPEEDGNDVIEL